MKTGFIGAGKMAEALISGLLRSGFAVPQDVVASDISGERLALLRNRYGITVAASNEELLSCATTVFLAVKPQDMDGLLSRVAPSATAEHLVVSIAAGKTLAYLESFLTLSRVVRVMPNMACLVGAGMSVFCPGSRATREDTLLVGKILSCSGEAIELPEEKFDAVTALSGSGPAFFAYWLKCLAEGGVAAGLAPSEAHKLSVQTMLGTAVALKERGMSPAELISAVASPKGTTAAGLAVLDRSDAADIAMRCIAAAAARSRELSLS